MRDKTVIQPVPGRHRLRAFRFLLAGNADEPDLDNRAYAYDGLFRTRSARREGQRVWLWWALQARKPAAVAMALENPGRTAALLFSPPDAPGVDPAALSELLARLNRQVLRDGLVLVQALVGHHHQAHHAALAAAGMVRVADLIYMNLDLSCATNRPAGAADDGRGQAPVEWLDRSGYDESDLAEVICRTHAGSLDCPCLNGLRDVRDVIASHRSSGVYTPESWWLVLQQGRRAGCLLINRSIAGDQAEVVYLGVVPEFRGRGLACGMLRRAGQVLAAEGVRGLALAVDTQNIYAIRAYERAGFRRQHVRAVWMAVEDARRIAGQLRECE